MQRSQTTMNHSLDMSSSALATNRRAASTPNMWGKGSPVVWCVCSPTHHTSHFTFHTSHFTHHIHPRSIAES